MDFIVLVSFFGFSVAISMLISFQTFEKIPRVWSAVDSALHALGDGNWRIGEDVRVEKGARNDEAGASWNISFVSFRFFLIELKEL